MLRCTLCAGGAFGKRTRRSPAAVAEENVPRHMKTRVARQLDVLALRHLLADACVILQPSSLDDCRGVLASLFVPGGEKAWIAEDSSGIVGFAQARPRRYVLGWELFRMQTRRGHEAKEMAAVLVHEILQFLQDRGIPRLFARMAEDSAGQEVLTACGFTHLLSESIYVRAPRPVPPPQDTPVGMRYRMPQDAWPLRQLENAQTPLLISQLEGLTSSSWSLPRQRLARREEATDLVVERAGDIVGWIGWTFVGPCRGLPEHTRLGLMAAADSGDLAGPLLDYALHAIGSKRPDAQIIVRLRDYQQSLCAGLIDRGFVQTTRYTLLIKHGRLEVVPKRPGKLFELVPAVQSIAMPRAPN